MHVNNYVMFKQILLIFLATDGAPIFQLKFFLVGKYP